MFVTITDTQKQPATFTTHKALALAATIALFLFAIHPAHAQSQSALYSFAANTGDGYTPLDNTSLVMDKQGNFYGTTNTGGAHNVGTVFKVTPTGQETLLHSFGADATDGASPNAGLIIDAKGNLYGTTIAGGANSSCNGNTGCGTVFKVTAAGKEAVLYSFCMQAGCADGWEPTASVIMDSKGDLYGTTASGGADNVGTVFKLTSGKEETVLHSFGSYSGDGTNPAAGLLMDAKGNLFGTTQNGGANTTPNCGVGCGTVFKLTSTGAESVLYSFGANSTDGMGPTAALIMDSKENLYGTTSLGGAYTACSRDALGCGTAFKVTSGGKETVLYSFCLQSECADGAYPSSSLIMNYKGNLNGTTMGGGATGASSCSPDSIGCGTVFELAPGITETVLYSFCRQSGCVDGFGPSSGLISDSKGNLYGTTKWGGASSFLGYYGGTVYKLTP